jgi:carbon storage regulator CsrA
MLVLSRKLNETIVIDGNIRITLVAIQGNRVRLGFEAPDRVQIVREELLGPSRPGEYETRPGASPERPGLADRVRPTVAVPCSSK